MTITFITGANKGLGHETARRLIEQGQTVLIGARDSSAGSAAADALGARFVQIDVTNDQSVAEAADNVAQHEGSIDVLINNAGVAGPMGDPSDLTGADVLGVLDVNVAGVVRTTTAFLPLLKRSEDPVVINVSSGMGSLAATHDPTRPESHVVAPIYTASKAALTMLTTQYAKALVGIRINAADPGYTATDFNGHSGHQTITEGTDAIVGLATEGPGHGSGRFVDREGEIS
ncbi:NAD(P)-dependent dehydrogenase (short-subunit alcohol dehydrogenase family) [Williamsia limnetica]|uniref:NAD(P)-dependent dehydrogenase (Short-subunit alcohol dehydrogenase family) n=1 Tax=Williamsia limnetica TaxID=882452 RepID=A0A318RKJ4_WILLI|nr:SDR family NAD(P)-dependent oxidoreductase [Williamsia limnetica]PYE17320.1 NAD(P)-dependent dehydrogenase (short-subunit alcohol dehydrogenase family) [Williamsia limnetica]